MFKSFDVCLPTKSTNVPSGLDWLHEIRYDGYRLRLERDGDRVRLITRGGYDWTKRFPRIVEAALKNRKRHFVIAGEAVILGVDGISDSMRCIPASTMTKSSFAPSMSWRSTATICGSCHRRCERPIFDDYWHEGRKASSSIHSSVTRSGLTCFGPPAGWVGGNGGTGPIRRVGRSTGSRSRTASTRRWIGSKNSRPDPVRRNAAVRS